MSTIYKNCTEAIVVISDINIKFMPSGKKGDTLDLAKFVTLDKIKNSVDLKVAVQKQWLYNMSKGARSAPQNVQVTSGSYRSPLKPKQPQMFVVHNNSMRGHTMDARQKAIVYDNANRQIKQVEKTEERTETSRNEGIKINEVVVTSSEGSSVSVVPTQQAADKVVTTTKNAGCITMTTKTIIPENIPMDLVEQVAREQIQENAFEATSAVLEMSADSEDAENEAVGVEYVATAIQLNPKKCSFVKKDGKQCGMRKVVGSQNCYIHNKEI